MRIRLKVITKNSINVKENKKTFKKTSNKVYRYFIKMIKKMTINNKSCSYQVKKIQNISDNIYILF